MIIFERYISPFIPALFQGQSSSVILHGSSSNDANSSLWGKCTPSSHSSSSSFSSASAHVPDYTATPLSQPTSLLHIIKPKKLKSLTDGNCASSKTETTISSSQGFVHRACRSLFSHITSSQSSFSTTFQQHSRERRISLQGPASSAYKSKLKKPSLIPTTTKRASLCVSSTTFSDYINNCDLSGSTHNTNSTNTSQNHQNANNYCVHLSCYLVPESSFQNGSTHVLDLFNNGAHVPISSLPGSGATQGNSTQDNIILSELFVESYSEALQALKKVETKKNIPGPTVFSIKLSFKDTSHDPVHLTFVNTNECQSSLPSIWSTLAQVSNAIIDTTEIKPPTSHSSPENLVFEPSSLPQTSPDFSLLPALSENTAVHHKKSVLLVAYLPVAPPSLFSPTNAETATAGPKEQANGRINNNGLTETRLQDHTYLQSVANILDFAHASLPSKCTKVVQSTGPPDNREKEGAAGNENRSSIKKKKNYEKLSRFDSSTKPKVNTSSLANNTTIPRPFTKKDSVKTTELESAFFSDSNNTKNTSCSSDTTGNQFINISSQPSFHSTRDSMSSISSGSSYSNFSRNSFSAPETCATPLSTVSRQSSGHHPHISGIQTQQHVLTYSSQYKFRKVSRPLSLISNTTQESEGMESLNERPSSICFSSPTASFPPPSFSYSSSPLGTASPTTIESLLSQANTPNIDSFNLPSNQGDFLQLQNEIKALQNDNFQLKVARKDYLKTTSELQETVDSQQLSLNAQAHSLQEQASKMKELIKEISQYKHQLEYQQQKYQKLERRYRQQQHQQAQRNEERENNTKLSLERNELEQMNKDLWQLLEEYEKNMDEILQQKTREMEYSNNASGAEGSASVAVTSRNTQSLSHKNETKHNDNNNNNNNNNGEYQHSTALFVRQLQTAELELSALRVEVQALRGAQKQHVKESQFLTKEYNSARIRVCDLEKENKYLSEKLNRLLNVSEFKAGDEVGAENPETVSEESKQVRFSLATTVVVDNEEEGVGFEYREKDNEERFVNNSNCLSSDEDKINTVCKSPGSRTNQQNTKNLQCIDNESTSKATLQDAYSASTKSYHKTQNHASSFRHTSTQSFSGFSKTHRVQGSTFDFSKKPENYAVRQQSYNSSEHFNSQNDFPSIPVSNTDGQNLSEPLSESPDSPFVPKYKLRLNPFRNSMHILPSSNGGESFMVGNTATSQASNNNNSNNNGSVVSTTNDSKSGAMRGFPVSYHSTHKRHKSQSLAAFDFLNNDPKH